MPMAIRRAVCDSSGRNSAKAKYGPAYQMNNAIRRNPIRTTNVRLSKANMINLGAAG